MTTILSTAFGERTRPLGIDYHSWPIHHSHYLDDLRAQAEALDLLRRGDYTPVAEHISEVLRNADQLCYRYVPLVERYVSERGGLYDRAPSRVFRSLTGEQIEKLRDVYRISGIDDEMRAALERLLVLSTVVVTVRPHPREVRRVVVDCWGPHEVEVTPGADPIRAHDLHSAERVRVRVPIDARDDQSSYAWMVLTASEAYIEAPDGRRPVYGSSIRHDFGRVPVAYVHQVDPQRGRWCPPPDEALLAETLGLSMMLTDLEHADRHGYAQRMLIRDSGDDGMGFRPQGEDKLPTGPEHWTMLPPGISGVSVLEPRVDRAAKMQMIRDRLRMFAELRGLPADSLLKSQYSSSTELALRERDRAKARAPYARSMTRLEDQVARLTSWTSSTAGVPLPTDPGLSLVYAEDVVDVDSGATDRAKAYETGEASPVDRIAKRENVSRARALELYRRNREETAA
jgi:hypothetical protein